MPTTTRNRLILKSKDTTIDDPSISFTMHTEAAANFSSYTTVAQHVEKFLTAVGTGGVNAVGRWLSGVLDHSALVSTLEVYNITGHLDGSPAGSPVFVHQFTLPVPNSTNGLPQQACITASFRSDYGTDVEFGTGTRPRARDRNRVYIGPLNQTVTNLATSGRCLIDAPVITDVLAAMFDLSTSVNDGDGNPWSLRVWSRAAAAVKLPTIAWVDDQFDTQRRRVDPDPGSRVFRTLASV